MAPTAVVVGAGPGIGKCVADRFAPEGFSVAVIAPRKETATRVASELGQHGRDVLALTADSTDEAALRWTRRRRAAGPRPRRRPNPAAATSLAVLALIGIVELLTAIGGTVREGERDLPALKAIGLSPRQITTTTVAATGFLLDLGLPPSVPWPRPASARCSAFPSAPV
jgi:hypothetical protein